MQEFILLGDFNKNMLNNDTDREWGNFTTSVGFTQLISEPTRVTNDSKTLIDHIYTNQRTNGPVNAHLISWPSKAQYIHNLENIW